MPVHPGLEDPAIPKRRAGLEKAGARFGLVAIRTEADGG
jgi:hypothetical protein